MLKYLSSNSKTGVSINLPIKGHCLPTKNCARTCYAKSGNMIYPNAKAKQIRVSRMLIKGDIKEFIIECSLYAYVRLNGSGDLKMSQVKSVIKLARACPNTIFWGMTRKIDIAKAINGKRKNLSLLVTVDATSPKSTWEYKGAMCYGPRMPGDRVPRDSRIVTVFPYHKSGKIVNGAEHHPKDCLAVWHENDGCPTCGKCWSWSKKLFHKKGK